TLAVEVSELNPFVPSEPFVPLQTYRVCVTSPESSDPLRFRSGPLRSARPPFGQFAPGLSVRASNTVGPAGLSLSPGTLGSAVGAALVCAAPPLAGGSPPQPIATVAANRIATGRQSNTPTALMEFLRREPANRVEGPVPLAPREG